MSEIGWEEALSREPLTEATRAVEAKLRGLEQPWIKCLPTKAEAREEGNRKWPV